MKRIFFIIFSLIMLSSCLDDGSGTTQKYQGRADFEYGAGAQFLPDSTFFNTKQAEGFGYDILNFYHQLDASKTGVDGGFILSCLKMPVSGKTEGLNNGLHIIVIKKIIILVISGISIFPLPR